MSRKEQDFKRLIASKVQQGNKQINHHMRRYISHRNREGDHIINVEHTYQNIQLAARVIVAVKNPADVLVVSSSEMGQRAVIKFAQYTGASSTKTSRWTPGTLTNQSQSKSGKFQEPAVLIVTDPFKDKQAVVEASYVNIPVIALCSSDNSLEFVDIPIPADNRLTESISMIYWLLAKEIKILRGEIRHDEDWDVFVDLFYSKDLSKQIDVALPVEEKAEQQDPQEKQEATGW
ncbi:hypothetical protein pb186bvf_006504 [Paramecium bursaria]